MSSQWITQVVPLTQLSVGHASVGASFTLIGKFSAPVDFGFIVSTFNQPVQLSFDGVTNNIVVPAGSSEPVFMELNFKQNNMVFANMAVWVEEIGTPPSAGSLYICGFSATYP